MKSDWQSLLRIGLLVLLVSLAWTVPDLFGLPPWVGLVLGVIVGIGGFFALGIDRSAHPS